jgi:hypothetical protein
LTYSGLFVSCRTYHTHLKFDIQIICILSYALYNITLQLLY